MRLLTRRERDALPGEEGIDIAEGFVDRLLNPRSRSRSIPAGAQMSPLIRLSGHRHCPQRALKGLLLQSAPNEATPLPMRKVLYCEPGRPAC